jgi:hypothetical protein
MDTSDAWLERMRRVGDPSVDALVADHLGDRPGDVGRLLGHLFRTTRMPEDHPLVARYAQLPLPADLGDAATIARGQRVFELFGPEVLLILGSYALPLAYAAGNGVQVIDRARRLKDEPIRRLCDTAQMVLNVMLPGFLEPGQVGRQATQKVRLVHALVRAHVQSDPARPWIAAWGVPINQEDQAGTLLSFSVAVLHGLRKMGARISREDGNAYIVAWSAVGRLLGVHASLLPADEEDAANLARRIGERQIRPTVEGQELAHELLSAVETLFPVRGYATSLSHFFLQDGVFGPDVAAALQLPEPNWTKWLVTLRAGQKRLVLGLLPRVPGARDRRSYLARRFAQALILLRRPDGHVPFQVPAHWLRRWRVRSA